MTSGGNEIRPGDLPPGAPTHEIGAAGAPPPPRAHEPEDTRVRTVGITLGMILASVVVVYGLMGGLGALLDRRTPLVRADTDLVSPRPPTAEPSVLDTLAALRIELTREQQRRLEVYEWIDRSAGIARIPIEDAIEILASRGSAPGARR